MIIGLGGSATNDGGVGMMQGLGAAFLDNTGHSLTSGGGALHQLASIDLSGLDPRLQSVRLEAACDVDNPLTGERGASAVFGPQKGADEEMVQVLDKNLAHFAQVAEKQFNISFGDAAGAGAAGGLGASLLGFLQADLQRGIDIVLKAVHFDDVIKEADLVITGEGRIDRQTIFGKTPIGVAKAAKQYHLPVIGIAGSLAKDSAVVHDHGIDALFSMVPGITSLSEAIQDANLHVERTARNIAAALKIGIKK
ncbi:glycerate kinase [Bacillus safensis FO-36b] [Bacillus safensis subsp. safensis]